MRTDVIVRGALEDDADDVARVLLDARLAALMPPVLHTDVEVRAWVASRLRSDDETWVAEVDGQVVAYARTTPVWLDDLYVAPAYARQGLGSALLDVVKSRRPDGFCLWVFEMNTAARDFYRRHGLIELEHTDGSENEERTPDLKLAWPGAAPLGFLRDLIDEVDIQLGDLLNRRAALTHAVQGHKPDRTRDPAREAEIVSLLASRAPALGPDRLARIVDAIVTESLDAAQ